MKILLITDAPRPTPFDLSDDDLDTLARAAGRDALVEAAQAGLAVTGMVNGAFTKADARAQLAELEGSLRDRMKAALPRADRLLATTSEIRAALIGWEFDLDIRTVDCAEPIGDYDVVLVDDVTAWPAALDSARRSQGVIPVLALEDGKTRKLWIGREVAVLTKPILGANLYGKIVDAVERRAVTRSVGKGAAVA